MNGTIKNLLAVKNYGFIKADGKEYFFHKEDFEGNWNHLVEDFGVGGAEPIEVTFDIVDSLKGPRAANVRISAS